MARSLVAFAAVLAALSGCRRAPDLPACDGTCLDVKLTAGDGADVRQVHVLGRFLDEGVAAEARFPDVPGAAIAFPAWLTLRLGSHHGTLALAFEGRGADGSVVRTATAAYPIAVGQRGTIEVALAAGGAFDLGAADAPADQSAPNDLPSSDGGVAVADLAAGDLSGDVPWRVAVFGDHSTVPTASVLVDGVAAANGVAPGAVGAWRTIAPGQHEFRVVADESPAPVTDGGVADLEPDDQGMAWGDLAIADLGRIDLARWDFAPADLAPADLAPTDLAPADLELSDGAPFDGSSDGGGDGGSDGGAPPDMARPPLGDRALTIEAGRRTTVFAAQQDCRAPDLTIGSVAVDFAPTAADMADLLLVHVGCTPAAVEFAVDAMTPSSLQFGESARVSVGEGTKTVAVFAGGERLATLDLAVAKGQVWTIFYYSDVTMDGPGGRLVAARDVP